MRLIIKASRAAAALLLLLAPRTSAASDVDPATQIAIQRLGQFAEGHLSANPPKIHFVYFTPADRTPPTGYRERLGRVMGDIQEFYAHEMERHGFGPRTIRFDRQPDGALVVLDVKGKSPAIAYLEINGPTGEEIRRESHATLAAAGIDDSKDTVIYFCDVRTESKGRIDGIGPYYGTVFSGAFQFGRCWFTDATILDSNLLGDKATMIWDQQYGSISVGRYNTIFMGGAAHELGHALGLPHDKEHTEDAALGRSLMGNGNITYREEIRGEGPGTFITLADAIRLASHPMFSNTERDLHAQPHCQLTDLHAVTRDGFLILTGRVIATPEPYAIIAYNDPDGNGDYDATTWPGVLDSANRFTLRIGGFKAGVAEMRITVCHVNGSNSAFHYPIVTNTEPDIAALTVPFDLRDALRNWAQGNMEATRQLALQAAQVPAAEPAVRQWATTLAGIAGGDAPAWPALSSLPPEVREASLSRVQWQAAQVGFYSPARNHFPREVDPDLPFLSLGGRYFADGLYAHAPSRYAFDLGRQWKTFSAEAGLQPGCTGSAIFDVKADDRVIFRSPRIYPDKTIKISADITGAKMLELVVEGDGAGNHSAWSIWCAPKVFR